MKILVTSDTHGYHDRITDLILNRGDLDLMLHAGDGVDDCENIHYETGIDYHVVKGNNDFFTNEPYYKVVELEGYRILLTHGHKEGIDYTLSNLIEKAKDNSCDIAIFGHIHRYVELNRAGILILNPGSPSLPRDGTPSAIIMSLDDKIEIEKVLFN